MAPSRRDRVTSEEMALASEGTSPDARRRWLGRAEIGFALLVLAFLGAYLVRNWSEVTAHDWTIDWGRLLAASAGVATAYSGHVLLWRHILARLGGSLSIADAHRIWYLANLARYVPGKVLHLAGTAYLGRAKGVSARLSVAAALTAQLFVLGAGLVIAALGLPGAAEGSADRIRLAASAASALFLLVFLTPLFGRLHRFALKALVREARFAPVRWHERLALTMAYSALWIVLGGSFQLFVGAVTDPPQGAFWGLTGVFAAAYLAGYLAVFVPGGLGVREGALAALLSIYVPTVVAVAVAFLARLWSTAIEVVVAALLVARYGVADLRAGAASNTGAHG